MRKLIFFLLFANTCAYAQKPSGVYSLNGAETVKVEAYISTPAEYFTWLERGIIPAGIKKFNGAYVNGSYIEHDRAFFQSHMNEMRKVAITQLEDQLALIAADGNQNDIPDPTLEAALPFLRAHTTLEYVQFFKNVYLLGIYGDFTRPEWVHHAKADGWYYVLTTSNGKKYLLARASCFNNVDATETTWIQDGFAKIRSEAVKPQEDDLEEGSNDTYREKSNPKPRIVVNGDTVSRGANANGDIYITVNAGDPKATVGDITINGGNSNNNLGGASASSAGGGKTAGDVYYDPNPSPAPSYRPAYQSGYQRQSQYDVYDGSVYIDRGAQYFGSLQPPYRSSCNTGYYNTGYGYSGGYSGGVVVPVPVPVPTGCYGGSYKQTPQYSQQPRPQYQSRPQTNTTVYAQPRGGFVPNGTGSYGRGGNSGGGFQSNGTGSYGRGGTSSGGGQHSSGGFQQNGTGGR